MKIRKVLIDTPLYTIGDVLQKSVAFLLLPFITRFLDPNELGKAFLVLLIASFLSSFITLNVYSSVIRFSVSDVKNKHYLQRLFATIVTFLIINTLVMNVILITLFIIINYFFLKLEFISLPILTIFLSTIIAPFDVYQRILISMDNAKYYLRNHILNFIVYSFFLFLFIFLDYSYLSIIFSSIISYLLFYILLILEVKKNNNGKLSIDYLLLKEILNYSIRLLPNRFFTLLPNAYDRFILSSLSLSSIALYSIGYRIGEVSSYATAGFFRIYQRWIYISLNEYEKNKIKIQKTFFYISIIDLCVACSLTIISKDLIYFFLDERYYDSWVVIPLISFSVIFINLRGFWMNFITHDKKNAYLSFYITFTFFILSVLFISISYQKFGIFGVGSSILFANFISLLVTLLIIKKLKYKIFGYFQMFLSTLITFISFSIYFFQIHLLIKVLFILFMIFFTVINIKKLFALDKII